MRKDVEITESGELYASAYAAQYNLNDVHKALKLYKSVVAAFPRSKEAGNAKLKIRNIENNLPPKRESLQEQMNSASALFVPED
jgi:hypothetical protein